MPVVKINAIEVPADAGPELEKRFAHRAHAVENSPGFLGFQLLRPDQGRRPLLRGDAVGVRRGIPGVGDRACHRGARRPPGQSGGDRRVAAGVRGCVRRCRIRAHGVVRRQGRLRVAALTAAAVLVAALSPGCAPPPAPSANAADAGRQIDMSTPAGLRAQQTLDMLNSDWPIGPVGVGTLAAPKMVKPDTDHDGKAVVGPTVHVPRSRPQRGRGHPAADDVVRCAAGHPDTHRRRHVGGSGSISPRWPRRSRRGVTSTRYWARPAPATHGRSPRSMTASAIGSPAPTPI